MEKKTKKTIILYGGGGHAHSCIDVIELEGRYEIGGIVDIQGNVGKSVLGYKIIGSDADLEKLVKKYGNFLITIGHVKNSDKRVYGYETLKSLGAVFPTIISPRAYFSKHTQFGEGTIVMHHAVINAGAVIGNNCIVNTGAIIDHDVTIGDHTHVSTGCVVNGGVSVGARTFIGSGSVIKEALTIADKVLVGAGSTVLDVIRESGTFVGSPARRMT